MRPTHRIRRLSGVLLCLAALAPATAAGEAGAGPKELIEQATETLVASLRENRDAITADRQVAHRIAEETVLPYLDFRRIARWVLGKHWRTATTEQKREFIREFQDFLTRTYVTMMIEFSDQIVANSGSVSYLGVRESDDGTRTLVRSVIKVASGSKFAVDYRMYRTGGSWKVYDVVVGGVSLAATYRTSFDQRIHRDGFDGLIAYLASRASE